MTILPASLPRHLSKSSTLVIGATMTPALMVPLVEGVQATGMARSSMARGDVMRALERTMDQPRPNSKPSARTFDRPQSRKRCWLHCSA
ncbi:hypothetical protein D3C72_1244160 [compost metagenome]